MVWDTLGHLGTIYTEAFGANASEKFYDLRGKTTWTLASLARHGGVFRHLRGMAEFRWMGGGLFLCFDGWEREVLFFNALER